jgi:dTDP-4-amino-4,6-dideoxygalactose transaminase
MNNSYGQQNYPDHDLVRAYFEGIFERQYYTESGPLVQRLEREIRLRLKVGHVVCVSNPSVAWLMLLEADLTSHRLLIPATASKAIVEAIRWIGAQHYICDVSPKHDYRMHHDYLASLDINEYDAIIGVNPWGGVCDIQGLLTIAEDYELPIYFDSTEAFACRFNDRFIGSIGRAEIFSFESENLVNGMASACICTDDEDLADRLRCMRGSGGIVRNVSVNKTVNGRMSEAQAAYALMTLENLDQLITRNRLQHEIYVKNLSNFSSIKFVSANGVSLSNFQQVVITFDTPNELGILLENLNKGGHSFTTPKMWCVPSSKSFAGIQKLCSTSLLLPLGSLTDEKKIHILCNTITSILS